MKKKKTKAYKNSSNNSDLQINSLTDFVKGIGSNLSQADSLMFNNRFYAITTNRALISQTYLEHGIVQAFIDQPVDDAYRGGIIIKCPELSADDIKDLDSYIEMNQIIETYKQALKWNRLYGGAGILINIAQDLTKPININSISEKTPLEFYAVDRWELSYTASGMSELDQLTTDIQMSDTPYNYYGHVIHRDNVIKLKNKDAPSLIRGQFMGWGVSELEKIVRSYNKYMKHSNITYECLDESKIDVFKINGFNSAISTKDGAIKTANRIAEAAKIKNYQNALVVDKEDDYEQKTLTFGGLAEILKEIRIDLACDLRMPLAKLFGLSAAGFNSGEDDIENYNAMVESEIRSRSKSGMIKMLQIICQKVLGYIPENLNFEFHPLRIMTNKEASTVKNETLNRIIQSTNTGLCTHEMAVDLINNEKIFSIDLDPNQVFDVGNDQDTIDQNENIGVENA